MCRPRPQPMSKKLPSCFIARISRTCWVIFWWRFSHLGSLITVWRCCEMPSIRIDVVSGSLLQITTSAGLEVGPAVSRDGRIAYTEFDNEEDLYVVSLEERSHERLTSHTGSKRHARISPDGARIVYDSARTGDREIWVIDRGTGSETRLASHPASDSFPTWSPDGKQVAFLSARDDEKALWVVNADGSGGPRRLTAPRLGPPALVARRCGHRLSGSQ